MIGLNAFVGNVHYNKWFYPNVKLHAIAKNFQRIINTIVPIQLKKYARQTFVLRHYLFLCSSQFSSFFRQTSSLYSSMFLHWIGAVVYISESVFFSVFWGGREGYHTLLNTDVRRELDHMGRFFQMVVGEYIFHQNCWIYKQLSTVNLIWTLKRMNSQFPFNRNLDIINSHFFGIKWASHIKQIS